MMNAYTLIGYMCISEACVAQWIAFGTPNPRVGSSTPGRVECACVLGQDTLSHLLRDSEITLSRWSRVQGETHLGHVKDPMPLFEGVAALAAVVMV